MAAGWRLAEGWLADGWRLACSWTLAGGWLAGFKNIWLLVMDDDFIGKFRLQKFMEYLRKRKTMRNITPAFIFSKLEKRKVKINAVLTSHVLLICLKLCKNYELNYPYTNMLSHTLIKIANVVLARWPADG